MGQQVVSKVWQIFGLFGKVVPGILVWDKGEVVFITEEGIQFNVPLAEIRKIKWPFLRMGFGFDTIVNGKKFMFPFSKPNHSAPEITIVPGTPFPKVVFEGQYFYDISSLKDVKKDKATTKQWKEILGGSKKAGE